MNTGIKDIELKIDWVTCTFDFIQFEDAKAPYGSVLRNKYEEGRVKLNELYKLLTFPNFDERTEEKKKAKKYSEITTLGEFINFSLNGCKTKNDLRHSMIEIPGNGCRDFIERGGNWFDLFKWATQPDIIPFFNFTRVDCAIDVYSKKYFDWDLLYKYIVENKCYSSPCEKGSLIHSWDRAGDEIYDDGNTIYIGKGSSLTQVCIYDKQLERIQAGDKTPMLEECWYRFEIRYRGDKANQFVKELIKQEYNDYSFISECLYKYLDIKELDHPNKKVDARPTVQWWKDFVNVAEKSNFTVTKKQSTLESNVSYLKDSVGKPLTRIALSYDKPQEFFDFIIDIIQTKSSELKKKDMSIINNGRSNKSKKTISDEDKEILLSMFKKYG